VPYSRPATERFFERQKVWHLEGSMSGEEVVAEERAWPEVSFAQPV
jgi:hypothetical protein